MPSLLIFGNCAEFAGRDAKSASDANIGIDYKIGFANYAGNCADRAFFSTKCAVNAVFCLKFNFSA